MKVTAPIVTLLVCGTLAGCTLARDGQVLSSLPSGAVNSDAIKDEVRTIDASVDSFRKVETTLVGESAEGGTLTGYVEPTSRALRLIDVVAYGETGQSRSYFYFDRQGSLVYAKRDVLRYASGLPTAPPKLDTVTSVSYLFENGVAFQDRADNSTVPITDPLAMQLQADAQRVLDRLNGLARSPQSTP